MRLVSISAAMTLLIAIACVQGQEEEKKSQGPARVLSAHALIAHEAVQKELELSDEQKGAVNKAAATAKEAVQGANKLEQKERQQKFRDARQQLMKSLGETLKKEQLQRFTQIDLRQRGALALNQKKLAEEVGLSGQQRKMLRSLNRRLSASIRKLREDLKGKELNQKMKATRNEARDKAIGILDEEQRGKWEKMLGEPFDLSKLQGRRRQ